MGPSFRRPQSHLNQDLSNAPWALFMGPVQALLNRVPFGKFNRAGRKDVRLSRDHLMGLFCDEFQGRSAVLWNEVGLCGLLKETPTAQHSDNIFF